MLRFTVSGLGDSGFGFSGLRARLSALRKLADSG